MNDINKYVVVNKAILDMYAFCDFYFEQNFLTAINELNKHVENISNDLVLKIFEKNKSEIDKIIENKLCSADDYYLLKIELQLRLITINPSILNNYRLSRYLDCLMEIYSSKNQTLDYERTLYLAGQVGEYLLTTDIKLSDVNLEKIKEITTWTASKKGKWHGYNDHFLKLKSII